MPSLVTAEADPGRLPPSLRRYCDLVFERTRASMAAVKFQQQGRLRARERQPWEAFRARQTVDVTECRFGAPRPAPFGLVAVVDSYGDGRGKLTASIGPILLASSADSDELARGEMMRYLAELPWAPQALIHNHDLSFAEESSGAVTVTAGQGARQASVTFSFDDEGVIRRAYAPDRPRDMGGIFVSRPWIGFFSDWRRIDGVLSPQAAEVGWLGFRGVETVWEGRITRWS